MGLRTRTTLLVAVVTAVLLVGGAVDARHRAAGPAPRSTPTAWRGRGSPTCWRSPRRAACRTPWSTSPTTRWPRSWTTTAGSSPRPQRRGAAPLTDDPATGGSTSRRSTVPTTARPRTTGCGPRPTRAGGGRLRVYVGTSPRVGPRGDREPVGRPWCSAYPWSSCSSWPRHCSSAVPCAASTGSARRSTPITESDLSPASGRGPMTGALAACRDHEPDARPSGAGPRAPAAVPRRRLARPAQPADGPRASSRWRWPSRVRETTSSCMPISWAMSTDGLPGGRPAVRGHRRRAPPDPAAARPRGRGPRGGSRVAASADRRSTRQRVSAAPVVGDPDELRRLVRNLVENAVAHAPRGSSCAPRQRDTGVVDVVDDGPGVPAGEEDAIFERFHRGDTARTRRGHGLGLSISRTIAERHGGTLILVQDAARARTPADPAAAITRCRRGPLGVVWRRCSPTNAPAPRLCTPSCSSTPATPTSGWGPALADVGRHPGRRTRRPPGIRRVHRAPVGPWSPRADVLATLDALGWSGPTSSAAPSGRAWRRAGAGATRRRGLLVLAAPGGSLITERTDELAAWESRGPGRRGG